MSSGGARREPFDEAAEEFVTRFRRGERPSLGEYVERYPDLAGEIREFFPALVMMEELGSVGGPRPPAVETATRAPGRLGEYRIVREVGHGGMGVVYEAVRETLGRHVALKVLPFHVARSPTYLERFKREARAAAQLHHSNIVPVHGVGEHEDTHFYAMQFIHGQSLDLILKELQRLRKGKGTDVAPPDPATYVARSLLKGSFAPAQIESETPLKEHKSIPPASTPISGSR